MAGFGTFADLFKDKPEVVEGMEDVARRSFPSKAPSEFTAEQLEALNNDSKLLDEYQQSLRSKVQETAPKVSTPEIETPSNTKVESGFQLGESKDLSTKVDPATERLRRAIQAQRGELVGEPRTPLSKFDQAIQRLEPSTKMVESTPDISSKLDKVDNYQQEIDLDKSIANKIKKDDLYQNLQKSSETPNVGSKLEELERNVLAERAKQFTSNASSAEDIDDALNAASLEGKLNVSKAPLSKMEQTIQKINGLSDEALSKMGSLGQKVLSNRLVSKGIPAVGAIMEGAAAKQNLKQGKYLDAAGNLAGVGSGDAALAGSSTAGPLSLAALGIAGGAEMGRQQADAADMGIGDMGMPIPTKEELSQGSQKQNPTDLLAVNAAKYADQFGGSSSNPIPTSELSEIQQDTQAIDNETPEKASSPSMSRNQSDTPRSQQPSSVSPEVSRSPAEEGFTENTVENLRKAQAEAARLKNFEDLNNTATILAGAAAGERHHATPSNVDELVKMGEQKKKDADSIVADFEARGEKEKSDPGSATSVNARNMLSDMFKQSGMKVNVPNNLSRAEIEKQFPQYSRMIDSKENRDARALEGQLRRESLNLEKDKKQEKGQQDWLTKVATHTKPIVDVYAKSAGAGEAVRSMTGKNPAEDVTSLYSFVKALDPDSAVREGEVGLAQSMASVKGKVEVLLGKIGKGDVVDTKTVDNLKNEILRLESSAKTIYNKRMTPFKEQAKSRGIDEGDFGRQVDPFYEASPKKEPAQNISKKTLPGSTVTYKGKKYKVGLDGDSLEEIK